MPKVGKNKDENFFKVTLTKGKSGCTWVAIYIYPLKHFSTVMNNKYFKT